ncbi:MAG: HAMP domain-containing histidine kinase [Bacteroidetes bacterium]|nr:HAMP domain-containing histidine kinase [Bacteroidota bacterium]
MRINLLFILLIILIPLRVLSNQEAQSPNPDLVLRDFIKTGDTTNLDAKLLQIELSFHLFLDKQGLYLLSKTQRIAEQKGLNYYNIRLLMLIAKWHRNSGNKELYIQTVLKLIPLLGVENKMQEGVWMLIDIGNFFYAEKEYGQAAFFYDKAIDIAQKDSNNFANAVAEINHGLICMKNNNFEGSKAHFRKSIQLRLGSDFEKYNCFSYIRLADAYNSLMQLDSALIFIKKAEYIYYSKGQQNALLLEMPGLIDLGYYNYYRLSNEPKLAGIHLKKSRKYLLEKDLINHYLETLLLEATVVFEHKENQKTINILEPALKLFSPSFSNDLTTKIIYMLALASHNVGDFENSHLYYERLVAFEDSLKSSKSHYHLNQIRSIIDLVERDSRLDIAEKELALEYEKEKARISERNLFIYISFLAIFSAIVLSYFLFRLKKQNLKVSNLHKELEGQNEKINEKAIKLEQSNHVKNKLFSIIAHDLRSPLNVLLGQIGIIKQQIVTKNTENVSPNLSRMEQTLKETVELFERLLQWSKLDKNEIAFNPVPICLESILQQVIKFFEPNINEKKIEIVKSLNGLTGYADANITQTILRNLISNAINAIDKDGRIIITADKIEGEKIIISISDNGKGFSTDWLMNFDKGVAIDVQQNHGLGLMLCKDLAAMNKGELILKRNDDCGSTVSFTIQVMEIKISVDPETVSFAEIPMVLWRQLEPLQKLKVYQSTQIKEVIDNIKPENKAQLDVFIKGIEKSVYLGNKELYGSLISEIPNDERTKNLINN